MLTETCNIYKVEESDNFYMPTEVDGETSIFHATYCNLVIFALYSCGHHC